MYMLLKRKSYIQAVFCLLLLFSGVFSVVSPVARVSAAAPDPSCDTNKYVTGGCKADVFYATVAVKCDDSSSQKDTAWGNSLYGNACTAYQRCNASDTAVVNFLSSNPCSGMRDAKTALATQAAVGSGATQTPTATCTSDASCEAARRAAYGCTTATPLNCTQLDCSAVNGVWSYQGSVMTCHAPGATAGAGTCEAGRITACGDETTCKNAGGEWGYQGSVMTCHEANSDGAGGPLTPNSAPEIETGDPALKSGNCNSLDKCDLISKYLNPAVQLLSAAVGIVIVIAIVIGGIQYGSSAGDPQQAAAAKARIRNAIIALLTFLFLYALLNFLLPGGLI